MPHVYIEVWTRYPWRDGQASQQLRDLSATHTVQEEKADLPEDLAWDMSIHEQQSERDWELWIYVWMVGDGKSNPELERIGV